MPVRAATAMRMMHEMGDANAKLNLWHLVAVSKFCQAVLPIAMRGWHIRRGKRGVLFTTRLAGDDASAAAAGAAGPGSAPLQHTCHITAAAAAELVHVTGSS